MRELKRLAWAAAVAAASAAPGFAQVTGGGAGAGTGGILGTAATTGISGTGTNPGGTAGGTGGAANASVGGTGNTGGTTLTTLQQAPNIVAPSRANISAPQAIASSNFLRNYYGAVYYQGSNPNNVPNGLPGGFGTALYPAAATGGAGRGGIGGTGGTFGGAGGRGGIGGTAGVNTAEPGGILVPLPRQIAYAAQARFTPPPAPPTQLLTNLRGTIDRAPGLTAPAGVRVQVDGQAVTLRGTVRDQDEARLVEGMVRLTPGVGPILNELTYPGK